MELGPSAPAGFWFSGKFDFVFMGNYVIDYVFFTFFTKVGCPRTDARTDGIIVSELKYFDKYV